LVSLSMLMTGTMRNPAFPGRSPPWLATGAAG